MRLAAHNMLTCAIKGCVGKNYPLKLEADQIESEESIFNAQFIIKFLPKVEWSALVAAAASVNAFVSADCHAHR